MYTITIMDKVGFSYYDMIEIYEVIDLGTTYNLITNTGDIFMEKDFSVIELDSDILIRAEYARDSISVYIELT